MARRPALLTADDFSKLPEDLRAELIDGVLVMNPSPDPQHQTIALRLVRALDRHLGAKADLRLFMSPCDVFVDEHKRPPAGCSRPARGRPSDRQTGPLAGTRPRGGLTLDGDAGSRREARAVPCSGGSGSLGRGSVPGRDRDHRLRHGLVECVSPRRHRALDRASRLLGRGDAPLRVLIASAGPGSRSGL